MKRRTLFSLIFAPFLRRFKPKPAYVTIPGTIDYMKINHVKINHAMYDYDKLGNYSFSVTIDDPAEVLKGLNS